MRGYINGTSDAQRAHGVALTLVEDILGGAVFGEVGRDDQDIDLVGVHKFLAQLLELVLAPRDDDQIPAEFGILSRKGRAKAFARCTRLGNS
jgi:hypothetical protein